MALKRELMVVLAGRLAATLVAIIAIRAVTSFLSPEQYGELALLIAVQMFCGLLLINPVGQHINLHTHAWWDDGTLSSRLISYRSYILWVALLGGLIAFVISMHHSADRGFFAFAAMFIMIFAGTWNATLIPMLNMIGFRGASALWSIASVSMGLMGSIALVAWLPSSASWFAGQALGMAFGALGARYVLQQHARHAYHREESLPLLSKNTIISYCLPLALATGLMWLQLSGYRFLIERYWGLAQLGFLAIGLQLTSQIFSLVESLSMQFFYPLFYRRVSKYEDFKEVELAFSDLLNTLVPVYLIFSGLIVCCAPYFLKILVASKFQNTIIFVILGSIIELSRVLGNLLSNAAQIKRKTKSLFSPYAAGSIVTLGFICFAGEQNMGVIAACVVLVIGAITMLTSMLIKMYREISFTIDVPRFSAGALIMILFSLSALWIPGDVGIVVAIELLVLASSIAAFGAFAILWKNPATLRLISVELRGN